MTWSAWCTATAFLFSCALTAAAQEPVYYDYPEPKEHPQTLKLQAMPRWLRFDGELRGRTEGQTSLNEVSANDRIYELTRARGGVTLQTPKLLRGYLEFQDTHALGLPLPQVASNQRDQFDLFQGYFDIHHKKLDVIAGRQLLNYGSERVVGQSDWTNNSRSWDGFVGHLGNTNWIELFSTSVVTTHPTSLDKHGAGLTFHGAVGLVTVPAHHLQVQPFVYIRAVRQVTSQQGIQGGEVETTFGVEVNRKTPSGLYYDLLGDLQRGSFANDFIHGGAGYAKVGYQDNDIAWKPRITGELDYATGNSRRDPFRISTYDQQYPSNHDAFGLVDVFGFQNIIQSRVNVDVSPRKNWTLLFQTEFLKVASIHDDVYNSAGQSLLKAPSAGFRTTDLGQGVDASTDYLFHKYFDLELGVGHLFPGRVLADNGKAPPLTLGYLQLTYKFKAIRE